jgi:iron complex outermembrane recepter protein
MFKRSKVSAAALLALSTLGGVLVDTAVAQERVEVTGSLIRRIEGEAALPVVVIRVDELQKAGVTNAEQAIKFITQQQGGTVTSGSVSGTNGAASYADLRSLGVQRTLVLLNGKRVVSNPFSSIAVDLNSLPLAAVERIETLPDGASSVYGTDAIAGVINFITKKSFKGGEVGIMAQVTEAGGGDTYNASVLAGIGDMATQGWNIFGSLSGRKQKPMQGDEREFSRSSYVPEQGFNGTSPTTFPANYSQTGTIANANPTSPNCLPPSSISVPEANGTRIRCFADTQVFTHTVPDQDQYSLFLRGGVALGADHTVSLEYFQSMNRVQTRIAPSPEGGLTMLPNSPYFPGNGIYPAPAALDRTRPISVSWRTTVLGSREGVQENDTNRLVAALEGTIAGWDYEASVLASKSEVENVFLNGYPMTQPLRNGVSGCAVALVANACPAGQQLMFNGSPVFLNPFGDQTAAGLAYMQANTVLGSVQTGEGKLNSVYATGSRSLFKMGGGDARIGLAAEFREEEMVYLTDVPKVSQAASSGLAGSGASRQGERDVTAVAAQLDLPLFKGFELSVGVRHDKYSDFGDTTNPKVSFRWQPAPVFLLRGSANTGFTAPTLTQLYAPNATTFTANRYNDPVLCPGGVPTAQAVPSRDCGLQFQRLTGGNPALTPEKSKAWTIGFVVQPTNQISVGIDFWSYHIKDSISSGIAETAVFADPVKYADLFIRCSQAPAERRALVPGCQTPGGDPLAYILNTNLNLGDFKTRGVDVALNWNSGPTAAGRFNASIRGSYVDSYEFQLERGGTWFNPNGNYNPQFGGPVIRYQQVSTFQWDTGPWSTLLAHRFVDGYWDQNAQGAPFNVAPFNNRKVGDYTLFDLSVSFTGIKGLTLNVGVLNLLDKDPPFTNQVGRFQARGYDDRFHNPLGRTYQVSAKYAF